MSTPFKMSGFSGFGNSPVKQKKEKYPTKEDKKFLDEQREESVKSMDYLTKTPVGPIVTEKEKKDRQDKARQKREKANRSEHNVEAKMDHYRDTFRK